MTACPNQAYAKLKTRFNQNPEIANTRPTTTNQSRLPTATSQNTKQPASWNIHRWLLNTVNSSLETVTRGRERPRRTEHS